MIPDPAASAAGAPVVEIRGVDKTFATTSGGVTALKGIDLTIRAGEFVSLIGPSGCGKSTLLRIIGDLTGPTAGDVLVNGKFVLRQDKVTAERPGRVLLGPSAER